MNASRLGTCLSVVGLALGLAACSATPPPAPVKPYNPVAYAPTNPDNVRVKVSLQNRAVYVMEGDEPLMVTAVAIGRPGKETPTTGNGRVTVKEHRKRSGTYGFWVRGSEVIPGERTKPPGGSGWRYQGHPMQWWVQWRPAYGFHEGAWPTGHDRRSAGCIRLHRNAAPKFYALVRVGTPVSILQTQPEDLTIGRDIERPSDYNPHDPHYNPARQVTNAVFDDINPRTLLVQRPRTGVGSDAVADTAGRDPRISLAR